MYGITSIKNLERKIEQNVINVKNVNIGIIVWVEHIILGILQIMSRINVPIT